MDHDMKIEKKWISFFSSPCFSLSKTQILLPVGSQTSEQLHNLFKISEKIYKNEGAVRILNKISIRSIISLTQICKLSKTLNFGETPFENMVVIKTFSQITSSVQCPQHPFIIHYPNSV